MGIFAPEIAGVPRWAGHAAPAGPAAAGEGARATPGKDEFLQLLVTQLRYQDPLRPVDDREFTAQLAQFSALELMGENARWTRLAAAAGLIGRVVTARDGAGAPLSGQVSSVRMADGRALLRIGGAEVDLARVVEVAPGT